MSYFDAVLLGVLQGLTEFLPVSSSGHLVLAEALLGVKESGVSFELLLHVGTLFAVLIYFRRRIWLLTRSLFDGTMAKERAMVAYVVLGTIPAGIVGVLFKDFFEAAFSSPLLTALMLFVTGLILLSTRLVRAGDKGLSIPAAILVGLGQAVAIMPGISRSGTTISMGILAGVKPTEAAEFSFLLSIPAIAGAVVLDAKQLAAVGSAQLGPYLAGALISFLSGLAAVYLVLAVIKKGKLQYFAYYCFAAGMLGLYLFL